MSESRCNKPPIPTLALSELAPPTLTVAARIARTGVAAAPRADEGSVVS